MLFPNPISELKKKIAFLAPKNVFGGRWAHGGWHRGSARESGTQLGVAVPASQRHVTRVARANLTSKRN